MPDAKTILDLITAFLTLFVAIFAAIQATTAASKASDSLDGISKVGTDVRLLTAQIQVLSQVQQQQTNINVYGAQPTGTAPAAATYVAIPGGNLRLADPQDVAAAEQAPKEQNSPQQPNQM
jgi:hypothetical protein